METAFDALAFARKFANAGMDRNLAEIQAEAFRMRSEASARALQAGLRQYDESARKDLATKGDIYEVRLEMQGLRVEMQGIRVEIQKSENRIRNWLIGILVAFGGLAIAGGGLAITILSRLK